MCYDGDASPPDPPAPRGAAAGEDLVLTTAGGDRLAAYLARPAEAAAAQVVILPDVRGLHQFYKDLALRFAEVGLRALALDYFGRTAGLGARDGTFDFMSHVQQMQLPLVFDDIAAARACLEREAVGAATFTLGFCMGGGLSLVAGMQDSGLSGVIAFYSGLSRRFAGAEASVLELAEKIRCPVLDLFGGEDPSIPASDVQRLDEQLDKAGVEHEIVVYPGAPHSFFDRKAQEYAEASADAWRRVLGFIQAHSLQA